jgi:hypothetical protein
VVGLSNEYQYVKRKNSDGFELELRNSVNKYLRMMMVGDFFASGSREFYYIFGLEVEQENKKEEEK